ncbi:phosphotransferase [Cellulomonas sp.]|uniref:phosphotransferase n=1 Tax=Cellulomonas sp. TaxID=40001 RepID=UPI001B2F3BB5|nr:phosphotransferase [Cellulomonas sp.]MBO9553914.1 phosphotransferase [Cellulomonas sp.]
MLTAPELVGRAVRAGLVTADDVLSGAVTVVDESRSNTVARLDVAGRPAAYVKQRGVAAQMDGTDPVGDERRALLALRGLTGSAGRPLVPALVASLALDVDSLWVQAVDGAVLTGHRGAVPDLARLCRAWGSATAALHRWPAPTAGEHPGPTLRAPLPWALDPDAIPPSMSGSEGTPFAAVLDTFLGDPALRRAAAEARRLWTAGAWVHGDLTASNVLVARSSPDPHVVLLDLEAAGLGDPGWDVATAIDSIGWLAPSWSAPPEPLVEHFLDGYRDGDGPGRAHAALQAVRAVMTAWQVAGQVHRERGGARGTVGAPDPRITRLLDAAQRYAAELDREAVPA